MSTNNHPMTSLQDNMIPFFQLRFYLADQSPQQPFWSGMEPARRYFVITCCWEGTTELMALQRKTGRFFQKRSASEIGQRVSLPQMGLIWEQNSQFLLDSELLRSKHRCVCTIGWSGTYCIFILKKIWAPPIGCWDGLLEEGWDSEATNASDCRLGSKSPMSKLD